MNFKRRLARLETQQQRAGNGRMPFRWVISRIGKPLDLATSTCVRRLGSCGRLTELVRLDGNDSGLSEAELEQFIASFPIHSAWDGKRQSTTSVTHEEHHQWALGTSLRPSSRLIEDRATHYRDSGTEARARRIDR